MYKRRFYYISTEKYASAGGIEGDGCGINIANCINCGDVTSKTLYYYNDLKYYAHGNCTAGGIAGKSAEISECINYDCLIKSDYDAGGIVGSWPFHSIENNMNKGDVEGRFAGGIAGNSWTCDFENNYTTVGYIIGHRGDSSVNVKNCYYRTEKTESKMKTEAFAETLGSAFVYVENDYPMLSYFVDYFKNKNSIDGDVNLDGEFNVSDAVLLQKWLLAVPDVELKRWENADFYADGKLDVFDLCMMKKALITQ